MFESHQLSNTLVELIQLWDLNVKAVRTSKLFSVEREAELFKERIYQFAELGRQLCNKKTTIPMEQRKEVNRLLAVIQTQRVMKISSSNSSFSVQHWIIPQGNGAKGEICTLDQCLSIIHQNLLQAACPQFSSSVEKLLPHKLAKALRVFNQNNPQKLNDLVMKLELLFRCQRSGQK